MNIVKLISGVTSRRSTWLWLIFGISCLYLVSFLILVLLNALDRGTDMSTYATNGTFQLYNPLRRLHLGQTIGYDFPFFHGVGVPFLYYPIFIILGGGVFAAETAKWFVSPILFLLSSFLFFYAYFRNIKKSTIATSLLIIISLSWLDVIWPRQSLMEARSTLPMLVAAALLWKTSHFLQIYKIKVHINELVALVLLGLSIPFGTEQGVAAILAYAIVQGAVILKGHKKTYLRETAYLALKGLFILSVAFVVIAAITKGHPISAIRYAFIDIPQDQGWYFGTDVTGYLTWYNLFPNLFNSAMTQIWIIIVCGILAFLILHVNRRFDFQITTFWYMLLYGLVTFVISLGGYFLPGSQSIPLQRMMILLPVLLLVCILFEARLVKRDLSRVSIRYVMPIAVMVLFSSTIFIIMLSARGNVVSIRSYSVKEELVRAKEARHKDDYFSSSLGWKESIDTFRPYINQDKKIWSTFSGVYDTTFGNQLNPSSGGEDYIFHALGEERRATYERDFINTRPHYVITLKPSYSDFEEWLWDSHWKIYAQIFQNYTLVSENSSHYLWQIKQYPGNDTSLTESAKTTHSNVYLPSNNTLEPIVYTVKLNYDAHSGIPLVSKMQRYFIKINTQYMAQRYQVSLPSQKTVWSFPVVVMPGEDSVKLEAFTDGILPFTSLTINSATYTKVSIDKNNMKPFENNVCFIASKKPSSNNRSWNCDPATYNLTFK